MNQILKKVVASYLVFAMTIQLVLVNGAHADEIKNPASPVLHEKISPLAVGFGNLLVPGLGATLQDEPLTGLTEAALEIGSFYGGTSMGRESRFKIDGSIDIPESGSVGRAATARVLQQFGLKYHFYNTFYHYQQAAIADEESERERNNPQPLYRGTWKDVITAPFQWDNLKSNWTWPIVLGVSAYLIYDYSQSSVTLRRSGLSGGDQTVYGASELIAIPVGSSFGEDPLFRGFIEREARGYTGSLWLAVLAETIPFALLHEDHVTSFLVGSYFGIEADALRGDLGPMMAAHFWINVVIGALDFFQMRRAIGKEAPLNPPVVIQFQLPIF